MRRRGGRRSGKEASWAADPGRDAARSRELPRPNPFLLGGRSSASGTRDETEPRTRPACEAPAIRPEERGRVYTPGTETATEAAAACRNRNRSRSRSREPDPESAFRFVDASGFL